MPYLCNQVITGSFLSQHGDKKYSRAKTGHTSLRERGRKKKNHCSFQDNQSRANQSQDKNQVMLILPFWHTKKRWKYIGEYHKKYQNIAVHFNTINDMRHIKGRCVLSWQTNFLSKLWDAATQNFTWMNRKITHTHTHIYVTHHQHTAKLFYNPSSQWLNIQLIHHYSTFLGGNKKTQKRSLLRNASETRAPQAARVQCSVLLCIKACTSLRTFIFL